MQLAVYVSEKIPVMLTGDPGRFQQILTNLVGNSIKVSMQKLPFSFLFLFFYFNRCKNHFLLTKQVGMYGRQIQPFKCYATCRKKCESILSLFSLQQTDVFYKNVIHAREKSIIGSTFESI